MLAELEPAKAGLAEVMPTTRLPGRALPDAINEFEERLERAEASMPSWHVRELDDEWRACLEGLVDARRRARDLRLEAPELGGFEGLIWAVEQLLAPLEPFEHAEQRFRHLRT